jgi:hypothetical protein
LEKDLIDYSKVCPEPFLNTATARATSAILTAQSNDPRIFEKFGELVAGSARLTTYSWHRTSFHDRFVMVESTMPYKQVVKVPKSGVIAAGRRVREQVRYPVVRLLKVSRLNGSGLPVDVTEDATITDAFGVDLNGVTGVDEGDLVSIRYEMNPVWIVTDYPYVVRDARKRLKQAKQSLGEHMVMPVHMNVKLDILVNGAP